jgi:hypothetical protein
MLADMRNLLFILAILLVGAVALAPAISFIGLDALPGDFTLHNGNWHMLVPVTYSLCASLGLGLFYYFMKR